MGLSEDLVSQFCKLTVEKKKPTEKTVNGTYRKINGKEYVQIDGSDILTPVTSTVEAEDEERVKVLLKNHTATVTGNISSPSARSKSVQDLKDTVDEQGNTIKQLDNTIIQQNNSIIELDNAIKLVKNDILAANNRIDAQDNTLKIYDTTIKSQNDKIDSMDNTIKAQDNVITSIGNTVNEQGNTISSMNNTIIEQGNQIVAQGNEIKAQGNTLEIFDSNIKILNSGFTIKDGKLTGLSEIVINDLETNSLNAKYANIDFTNISQAAVKKIFADSGIIKDLIVSEGKITGELVGVTIKGDLIEGNTIIADKLVVKGENGLLYKLNVDALGEAKASSDEKYQNQLDGSVIVAKSITAEKVSVNDLVAFGATIGGFNITKNSIYSGAKESILNTTRGSYMDDEGQFAIGDGDNFIRYFLDPEKKVYKLEIAADVIKMGGSSKNIDEAIKDIVEEIDKVREETTINLKIESSRGTVFKNNQTSTVLSVIIYRGPDRITDMETLKSIMGDNVYLQWKWRKINDDSYGIISIDDEHISENGFKYTITPDDVDTQVTFMCELMNE